MLSLFTYSICFIDMFSGPLDSFFKANESFIFIYLFKSLFTVGIQKLKLINSNKKMYW